ncbi:hypothetical protein [Mycobacterium sp.]|uniref:hypothetical protein n=1 Tax=Mycobacterium sp. TaxID=1785 RepID=UPI002D8F3B7F|nr:hypothetical protein [Mycobacterium sp.]
MTIVGACGLLWLLIWLSARHTVVRNWAIGIAALYAMLGSCGLAVVYAEHVQNERWCSAASPLCKSTQFDWRSWMPLVISLAIVGYVALRMNTQEAQSWTQKVLENGAQAPSFLYIMALILRMQLVIIGFIGMSALFWVGDSNSGQSLLTISLLFLLVGTLFLIPILWVVLSVNQLGKFLKAWGFVYGIAPVIFIILLLSNQNSTYLLNTFYRPGGDSRYLALVLLFGLLSAYTTLGKVLAGKLHTNLGSLEYLTAAWTGAEQIDPGPTLSALRRIKRSAHVVAVITAGISIGFIPPALHLPDVLGMIVGVGFVTLISYLDAELASRQAD